MLCSSPQFQILNNFTYFHEICYKVHATLEHLAAACFQIICSSLFSYYSVGLAVSATNKKKTRKEEIWVYKPV
jgi:hypothetical protein